MMHGYNSEAKHTVFGNGVISLNSSGSCQYFHGGKHFKYPGLLNGVSQDAVQVVTKDGVC